MPLPLNGPPRPNVVAYASELGCALNTSLANGGGTDDTAALNAFLATASATHPIKLVLDGPALISGLLLAPEGHTTIEGLGPETGFFAAPRSPDCLLKNRYPPTLPQPSAPPPRTGANVVLRNFFLNGNAAGNAGNRVSYGIGLVGVEGILLDGLAIANTAAFCTRFDNCADILITRCRFSTGANLQDGVHICGPAERITVRDCHFATGDDAIALNCPEGYGGDITDALITDCFFRSAWTAVRVYTSHSSQPRTWHARRLVCSRLLGSTQTHAFNFGIEASASRHEPNQLEDLLVSACDLSAGQSWAVLDNPFGSVSFVDCVFRSPRAAVAMVAASYPGGDLLLSNCNILRNEDGHAAAYHLDAGPAFGTLRRITLNQLRLTDGGGETYPTSPYMTNLYGPIEELHLGDIAMFGFRAFTNSAAAGWGEARGLRGGGAPPPRPPDPDSIVDNGVLYLSATTGKVSIKVGGVVQSLT